MARYTVRVVESDRAKRLLVAAVYTNERGVESLLQRRDDVVALIDGSPPDTVFDGDGRPLTTACRVLITPGDGSTVAKYIKFAPHALLVGAAGWFDDLVPPG